VDHDLLNMASGLVDASYFHAPETTPPSVAGLDLKAADEVDHVLEAPPNPRSDAAFGNGDGLIALAGAGTAIK
jgi:hypothetical protein